MKLKNIRFERNYVFVCLLLFAKKSNFYFEAKIKVRKGGGVKLVNTMEIFNISPRKCLISQQRSLGWTWFYNARYYTLFTVLFY